MFTYYQNTLCVHGGWLYGDGGIISGSNYKYHKSRGNLRVINRACKGTPALVEYESLPARFKRAIEEKIGGHPRKLVASEDVFEKHIIYDESAAVFYGDYVIDAGDSASTLPEETQREYISTASILNAVGRKALAMAMHPGKKRSKMTLWESLADLVARLDTHAWPHHLPVNARRFRDRYKRYQKEGYESLIHKNFSNKNSEKIAKDAGIWLLARWADQVRVVPNLAHLFAEYNREASAKGWKPLKREQTLRSYLWREDIKHLWWGHRYGDAASKAKFTYQHSTKMPTMRDSLWYGDGTKLNYYYREQVTVKKKDGSERTYWKLSTCTVYEVMDAYSEVFLGFHISKSEDHVAIYESFKMAVQTARHRPYQVSLDNQSGGKKLTKGHFLTAVARMAIHTKPYNAKSKTIENAFGRFQQQYLKKDWFFTGQNVKAKKQESQQKKEFINAQPIENFPTLSEVLEIYQARRGEWNQAPHHATGKCRLEMYHSSENPQTPSVDEEGMVKLFWVLRDKPITFRAEGLRIRRGETEDLYTVMATPGMPDVGWVRRHVDHKFWIYEDPSNKDLIQLCTGDHDNLRIVAQAELKTLTHRGKQEQEAWEAEYYNKVNDAIDAERQAAYDTMEGILREHERSAEDYALVSPGLLGKKQPKKRASLPVKEIGKAMKEEAYEEEEMSSVSVSSLQLMAEEEDMDLSKQI